MNFNDLNNCNCSCNNNSSTITINRLTNNYTVLPGYLRVSITVFSPGHTINGASVPAGFTWSVSSINNKFSTSISIIGNDFLVTEVR